MKYIIQVTFLALIFFGALIINMRYNSGFSNKKTKVIVSDIMDKQKQDALSPEEVVEELLQGNERYTSGNTIEYDHLTQITQSLEGQYPKAAVLACIDSRVPVEQIFDKSIGDLFVARVAGNLVNKDILGSMEYAAGVAGSKVILVLGHEQCGAVTAAIQGIEMGHLTSLLHKLDPAIKKAPAFDDVKIASNTAYVNHVSRQNVLEMIREIRAESPILRQLEENGAIKIQGAIYHMHTGKVELI